MSLSQDGPAQATTPSNDPRELLTVEAAAKLLQLSPHALRARCRRRARREKGEVVARLGAGIVAVKLGATWRIRFQES